MNDPSNVPDSLLLTFFQRTTETLNEHPSKSYLDNNNDDDNTTINDLRMQLMQIQMDILQQVVQDYNNDDEERVVLTVEEFQSALQDMGENDNTLVESLEESMNEAARCAFARVVLLAQMLKKGGGTKPNNSGNNMMDPPSRDKMMEWFGLCTVAVRLPQVQEYLRTGLPIRFDREERATTKDTKTASSTVQNRLEALHHILLDAVLEEETTNLKPSDMLTAVVGMMETAETDDDEDFVEAYDKFQSSVRNAIVESSSSFSDQAANDGQLSDRNDGGVTRVVSVTYSEQIVDEHGNTANAHDAAPQQSSMDQREDVSRQRELDMAKKAAELQQSLLTELLNMEEKDREELLKRAEQAHGSFLAEALSIPHGPERILFMQDLNEERRKMLLVHKLWSSVLAQNGGKVPTLK